MKPNDPVESGRQHMIDICTAIGLDPNNIAVEGFSLNGDTCTFMEFDLDDRGSKIRADDNSGYVKHERTVRLRPVERLN